MGHSIFKYTVAVSALAFIDQPSVASEYYQEVAGWTVVGSDESCAAFMDYEGPGSTQLIFSKFTLNKSHIAKHKKKDKRV